MPDMTKAELAASRRDALRLYSEARAECVRLTTECATLRADLDVVTNAGTGMTYHELVTVRAIIAEARRAAKLHPHWPADTIHAAAIVAEESGELVRAALRVKYEGGAPGEVETEAIHTAATCLRLLAGR